MYGRRSIFIAAAFLVACSSHGSQSIVPAGSVPNHASRAPAAATPAPYGPVEFKYTGKPETYVVPDGVTSLSVTLYGARSGGAFGGATQATIPVKPGEVLTINVGGDGQQPPDATGKTAGAGGYNGGGDGAVAHCCFARDATAGTGGGGATSIAHADGRWAAIAGGGGGNSGSGENGGSGGGAAGQNGATSQYGTGGAGGTQNCDHSQIGPGTAGRSGPNSAYGGGGGGGGYCGGDGGSGSSSHDGSDVGDAGGGGGSGYFEPDSAKGAATSVQNAHNASVLIVPPPKLVTMVSGFNHPWGVAVDAAGNVAVADTGNAVVKQFDANGNLLKTYTGFKQPEGVAFGPNGSIYVADFKGETLTKISPDGTKKQLDSGRNFESVAVLSDGTVYAVDRGYSSVKFAYYWELFKLGWELFKLGDKLDIYWDWSTGSAPHEIAVQNTCTNPYQPCYIYTQVEIDQGKGKSPKHAVWAVNYGGTHSTVSSINITPDAGLAYNGVTLWVASQESNAVCGLYSGVCSRIGNFWQQPMGLAVTPNCTTLCTLYIVDQAGGVVKKLVP